MFPKIDPKSLKKWSLGAPGGGPWASRGAPGASRNPMSRKSSKKYDKSRENDEKWGSQNHRFFLFSHLFGSEKKGEERNCCERAFFDKVRSPDPFQDAPGLRFEIILGS